MDSYRNLNPNAVTLPPNPPSEFNQHQLQHHQRSLQPPPQWYPNQSQYQPTLQPPPPPPPPPGMQNQYPSHPQHRNPHLTENHAPYPPPPVPYPNQQYHVQHQFTPMNRPQMHPPPPYHVNQVPSQPYSARHQEWGNSNRTHHPGYEYPGQDHIDDWATRAKAWAAAKSVMDSQQQQAPFPPIVKPELQTQFNDQYANVADLQQLEMKPDSHPVAYPLNPYGVDNYQQVQGLDNQSNNMSSAYQYGQGPFSSASMTSGPDYQVRKDGLLINDSRSTVHKKEVPSSYSSCAGKEVASDQSRMQFSSYPGPGNALLGGQQLHATLPVVDQPELLGRSFSYINHNVDLSDKPLNFAPRGNVTSVYPHHSQSGHNISVESSTTMPINHSWASHLVPDSIYPSAANSGSQVAPLFVDVYGASSADRPKKQAAVPNWLKEEIIKKKAVMATYVQENCKEETQFVDGGHQSFVKDDQAESNSVHFLRSAEEEDDDDEDYVEAARTAAVNKEIKRVLTEVLLKVTDDLFDEIATRVLSEEEVTTTEVDSLLPATAINQSSAKVLVPNKLNGTDAEKGTGNASSELPGNLLGLISYGTDSDDENNEISPQERMNNNKYEYVRNGQSPDENVPDNTKSMEKLDATSSMGAKNTDSFGKKVMEDIVSGTKGSDRDQQNGISSLVRDREQSNQGRTKETSGRESRIASDKRVTVNKTISRISPVTDVATDRVGENQSEEKHEKHPSKGKLDYHNGSKDGKKEGSGTDEKQKDSNSRKRSSYYDEKYKTETERGKREGGRENNRRYLLEDDDMSDRSRHNSSSSSRHKKGRSPSPNNRRKKNKPDSSVSSGSSTNDDLLDDSERRKSRSKRRLISPSPVRSRKRQVSRSPENFQRRQSSYYSVETSRKKRSRSRSPGRHC